MGFSAACEGGRGPLAGGRRSNQVGHPVLPSPPAAAGVEGWPVQRGQGAATPAGASPRWSPPDTVVAHEGLQPGTKSALAADPSAAETGAVPKGSAREAGLVTHLL